jgi:hypothetical protein
MEVFMQPVRRIQKPNLMDDVRYETNYYWNQLHDRLFE